MKLKEKTETLAHEIFPEIVAIRRHLHQYPELSYKETNTSAFICKKLDELGIDYKNGYAVNGIIARITGNSSSKKTIALRADMDALPINEANEVEYKSKNEGVMHACGHDFHSASLLGTAMILQHLKDEWEGTILLIFQPAEEKLPGGAKLMMEEGAFDNDKPDMIIAQHVLPSLEAGKAGFRAGMYMASADELYLTVQGKGGHAAMPHQLNDPVLAASHIVVALQQIVSRNAEAAVPSVLSFGKIVGNGATNVIPNEVKLDGTFRTMNEAWRNKAHEKMLHLAKSVAEGMGCRCDFEIKKGYPFLVNDEKVTRFSQTVAVDYLGEEQVIELPLRMTSEDFAYFSQQYPATMYRIGVMNTEKNITSPLHSPTFNVDENTLKISTGLMAYMAVQHVMSNR